MTNETYEEIIQRMDETFRACEKMVYLQKKYPKIQEIKKRSPSARVKRRLAAIETEYGTAMALFRSTTLVAVAGIKFTESINMTNAFNKFTDDFANDMDMRTMEQNEKKHG